MLRLIMCFLIFFLFPIAIGLGTLLLNKRSPRSVVFGLIVGIIIELALFELLCIPMRFMKNATFIQLRNIWFGILCILSILSIIKIIKHFKEISEYTKNEIKKLPIITTIIFVIILSAQCYVNFKYMHGDDDDATFIGLATTALDNNSLKQFNRVGVETEVYETRNFFSPYYIYTAVIASLANIHPLILAHTIFPVVFLIYAFATYYLLGNALFDNDKKQVMTFLVLLCIMNAWGDYSRYTLSIRMLTRIWQGKAVLVSIIVPFIWYLCIEHLYKTKDAFYWLMLFIITLGSAATSSMSFALIPIMLFIISALFCIKDKKITYISNTIFSIIPVIVLGILYLLVK